MTAQRRQFGRKFKLQGPGYTEISKLEELHWPKEDKLVHRMLANYSHFLLVLLVLRMLVLIGVRAVTCQISVALYGESYLLLNGLWVFNLSTLWFPCSIPSFLFS